MKTTNLKVDMVDLKTQYDHISREVNESILRVVASTRYINGPEVAEFSKSLENYLGIEHVIPCANGTDALHAALMALELKPGDEIITTPFTFVATAEVIAALGLVPVFADIEPDTFNLDVVDVSRRITSKTKCIIPVHLFGQPCDMRAIMALAEAHGLYVVEDNAQALGSDAYDQSGVLKKSGTIGHIGCTSFFPSKNLGCYGDGGAIFTGDENLAHKIREIVNHGSSKRYYYERVGMNSRLDTIQAAILNVKLPLLDEYNRKRQEAASIYKMLLKKETSILLPFENTHYGTHVYHQYTLRIKDKRDEVAALLNERGIACAVYYPLCLHQQKPYMQSDKPGLPHAENAAAEVLSLPMHTEMDKPLQTYIAENLIEILNQTEI